MINLIKNKINNSDFLRNVIIIMTGTGLSQIITLLLTPALTNYYSPSDFGFYTIYMSVFFVINTISTGKYERVILLVNTKSEIQLASTLSLVCSVFVSFLLPLLIYLLSITDFTYLDFERRYFYLLYLMPFMVFVVSLNLIIITNLNKQQEYKIISASRVIKTIITLSSSLIFIIFQRNAGGLIISEFIGACCSTIYLFSFAKGLFKINIGSRLAIIKFAKKYKKFPLYNIPADFLNITSAQMPVFFLSMYYGPSITGYYSLMKRVLDAPINLLSSSILEVFRQKAAEQYLSLGNCRQLFIETAKKLTIVSIIPFMILFIFSPILFSTTLGSEWEMAGEFSRIFSIYYFFKFISSPLSYMFYLAEKQNLDFFLHIYIFISTLLILNLPAFLLVDSLFVSSIYMINFSIIYVGYLYYSYKLTVK